MLRFKNLKELADEGCEIVWAGRPGTGGFAFIKHPNGETVHCPGYAKHRDNPEKAMNPHNGQAWLDAFTTFSPSTQCHR